MLPDTETHGPIMLVCALADELIQTVGMACALASSNRPIDLSGLEDQVAALCAGALALPPEQRSQARARLIALSAAMEDLSRRLAARGAPSG